MIPRAIKQYLPGSSRSLHAMHEDMGAQFARLFERLDSVEGDLRGISTGVRSLDKNLDAHDTHMKMFAWEQYRRDDESLVDAKKRFFRELPKATGGIRLLQLGCAQLLSEFHELCRANNLRYWMDFGTLLGAVRQSGFVSWDDDVDLGMPRNDLLRLISLVNGNPTSRFRVTVLYDYYCRCRQVRFWYRDEVVPCFLDLFIYDWTDDVSSRSDSSIRKIRDTMLHEMQEDEKLDFWVADPFYCINDSRYDYIAGYFDRYVDISRQQGLACDEEQASGVLWGVDNMEDGSQSHLAFPNDVVFPLVELDFEGKKFYAPRDYEYVLENDYGDYLSLPNDIHSHVQHTSRNVLDDPIVRRSISSVIERGE